MRDFDVNTVPLRGMTLVEASAGTGKTHAIATLYLRLLLEEAKVDQILVVTFTEAATSELRERIRARIQAAIAHCAIESALSESQAAPEDAQPFAFLKSYAGGLPKASSLFANALRDFDDAQISTIHGFCQRVLQDRAFESDVLFESDFVEDIKPLIDEIARDFWALKTWQTSTDFAHWVSTHFPLETARRLARKAVAHASFELLPHASPNTVPNGSAFHAAFERVRKLWNREELITVLGGLKGHYKRYASKWCAELDDLLTHRNPLPNLPSVIEHFASEKVEKNSFPGTRMHPLFAACDELRAAAGDYAAALDQELLAFKRDWISYLTTELERRKLARGLLSFDDLLRRLHAALHGPSGNILLQGVAQRYRAALIDEFQDTDDVQYRIFDRICKSGSMITFLIGDPKQAIYSFRGADVFAYMKAALDTPETQRYTMTTNYRSDPSLVRGVTRLFRRAQFPFLLADITCPEVRARPEAFDAFESRSASGSAAIDLGFVDSSLFASERGGRGAISKEAAERLLSELVAVEIANLLARGDTIAGKPVTANEIAVLTRTNLQAFAVQSALRKLGVYGVVIGDRSVYLSEEARELQLVLSAALEPTNRRCLRAALSTDLLGKNAEELQRLESAEDEWDAMVGDFRRYNAIWSSHNFVQMLRTLMRDYQVEERLLELQDGERRMTNLLHLLELLHAAGRAQHLGPHALTHYLAEQRRSETFAPDSEQIRLESDRDAVTLTTVHKSKGLEYPIVFCPFLALDLLPTKEDGKAPIFHRESDGNCALDLGSEEIEAHRDLNEREQFSENLRLLYVALTRARHRLSIFWGRYASFEISALSYLLFPPPDADSPPATRATSAILRDLDEAATFQKLSSLNRAGELAVRRIITIEAAPAPIRAPLDPPSLACRAKAHAIDQRFRTSSFTSFTREHRAHQPEPAAGRDWDDQVGEELPLSPAELTASARTSLDQPITLLGFPRGARAGNFFHELFEHTRFDAIDPALIATTLRSYGYAQDFAVPVEQALSQVVSTPLLPGSSLSLGVIGEKQRKNELEFFLPVRTARGANESGGFDPSALAQVFAEYPSPELPSHYSSVLEQLSFLPLRGFVRGFIDLVFEHEGRFYVVDYKTNHLGNQLLDYRPNRVSDAMVSGHYFLQYHLYALAVHRYLERRLRGYDYDRHFGGVLYLFIKGMTPSSGMESGVFYERPPKARLARLSRALEQPLP